MADLAVCITLAVAALNLTTALVTNADKLLTCASQAKAFFKKTKIPRNPSDDVVRRVMPSRIEQIPAWFLLSSKG